VYTLLNNLHRGCWPTSIQLIGRPNSTFLFYLLFFHFIFFILGTFCSINFVVNAILQLTIKQSNYTLFTTTDSFFCVFYTYQFFVFVFILDVCWFHYSNLARFGAESSLKSLEVLAILFEVLLLLEPILLTLLSTVYW